MKNKNYYVLAVFMTISISMYAQSGKVYDDLTLQSSILGIEMKYAVYLPSDYDISSRQYPVLYLLHGANDNQMGWIQYGNAKHVADEEIRSGRVKSMVIIMPHAPTEKGGYFNSLTGDWSYEDFFFDELMPHVEDKFRIRKEKRFRAIAGLSMGGGGTFMYALKRPELFLTACPLSAYIGPLSFEEAKQRFAREQNLNDADIREYYENHNALSLINNWSDDNKNSLRWYIDCGDDDFLYEGNSLVHIAMIKNNIPHEFRIRDGGHDWKYWSESLSEVLRFVSEGYIVR